MEKKKLFVIRIGDGNDGTFPVGKVHALNAFQTLHIEVKMFGGKHGQEAQDNEN